MERNILKKFLNNVIMNSLEKVQFSPVSANLLMIPGLKIVATWDPSLDGDMDMVIEEVEWVMTSMPIAQYDEQYVQGHDGAAVGAGKGEIF